MRQRHERKFGFRNSEFGESHTPNPKVKLHPQCAEGTSENSEFGIRNSENRTHQPKVKLHPQCAKGASEKPAFCTSFPFDEKCSDFAQVAPFFRRNRRQMSEIWAFIGKSRPYPYAQGKTNLFKSVRTWWKVLRNCRSCCFRRWQAVHMYCEPPKTKRLITSIKADISKSAQNIKIYLHPLIAARQIR